MGSVLACKPGVLSDRSPSTGCVVSPNGSFAGFSALWAPNDDSDSGLLLPISRESPSWRAKEGQVNVEDSGGGISASTSDSRKSGVTGVQEKSN